MQVLGNRQHLNKQRVMQELLIQSKTGMEAGISIYVQKTKKYSQEVGHVFLKQWKVQVEKKVAERKVFNVRIKTQRFIPQ